MKILYKDEDELNMLVYTNCCLKDNAIGINYDMSEGSYYVIITFTDVNWAKHIFDSLIRSTSIVDLTYETHIESITHDAYFDE